jgi:lambda family phage portal protein
MGYNSRNYNVAKTQYNGAKRSKHLGRWGMKKKAPDVAIKDLPTLRGRSDSLYKNNSLARSAVNKNLDNVIGAGLRPHPTLNHKALGIKKKKAKKLSKALLREFNFLAESINIDAEHSQNFYELQRSKLYMMLIGGDAFSLLPRIERPNSPYTTAIATISADQVCNPNSAIDKPSLAGGVEVNVNNAPIAYHILKEQPNGLTFVKEWQKVEAFDEEGRVLVLHLFQKLEAGQKRGVPYLAPIIGLIKTLGDYTDAEVTASLVSALFTVFVKSESGDGLDFGLGNEEQSEEGADYALSAGAVVNLKDDEDITIADPNRPNKNYDIFHRAIIKELAVGLNLSYEILMTEFNNSFTSSRAVILQVWKYFKGLRTLMVNKFCQPIYERVIEEAVLLGRLELKGFIEDPFMKKLWLNCVWTGEQPGAIDEIKEVKASKLRIDAGLSTRKREASIMNGTSFDDNINVAEDESRKMIDANLMDKKEKPEKKKSKKKVKNEE